MSLQDKSILTDNDIMNALPGGLIAFEDAGTIEFVNDSLLHLLNYQKPELVGRNVSILFTLSTSIFFQTHIFPLMKLTGKVEEIFLSLKTSDGRSIPAILFGKRISTGDRSLNLWELLPVWQRKKYEEEILLAKRTAEKTLEDNADLRRIKEELEIKTEQLDRRILTLSRINEEYAAFSKVISHDLQEPIRKIYLSTDLLKKSGAYQTERIQIDRINNAVTRLESLTACLDRYVSIDTLIESPQVVNLNKIVENGRQKAVTATGFSDFDFFAGPMPEIEGHPSLLTQLFYEILKNAFYYRSRERRLEISVTSVIAQYNHFRVSENRYKYVDFVKIDVTDNGNGFEEQYTDYIFQMFRRLDYSTPGLGFGLPFAKKIVDKHFGTISGSGEKGSGSRFQILLPLKSQESKKVTEI